MYFEKKGETMTRSIHPSNIISFMFCSFFFVSFSSAAINVAPVVPTPYQENAKIEIISPKNMQMENSYPIKMQVKVTNYAIGTDSDFPRKNEIKNSSIGQAIKVIIDNNPSFSKVTDLINPNNNEETNVEQIFQFNLPENIKEGEHLLRAYLTRSFGESLKSPLAFTSSTFYYKNKSPLKEADLKKPFLTLNEPGSNGIYDDSKPILLDFYVNNCKLSKDGYKVKLSIDNEAPQYLDKWTPYYIYGLRKGSHQIELQLVDKKNTPVPGLLNTVKTNLEIK